MNKQIEEIKAVLVRTCKRVRTMQEDHMQDRYAEALYTAGYRKQIVGEWIPTYTYTAEGTGIYKCSLCGRKSANPKADNFCPSCGARMKGDVGK